MSSREPMECSAEGLLRGGGKGEISVCLVSWASVSRSRRRLRLLLGVLRERRDSAFFMAGLSSWGSTENKRKELEISEKLIRKRVCPLQDYTFVWLLLI